MFVTVSSKAGVRWFKLLLPFRILMRLFSYVFIIFIREEVSLLQTAHFPWGPGTSLHGRSRIGLWRLAGAMGGGRAQRQVWRETRAPFFFFFGVFSLCHLSILFLFFETYFLPHTLLCSVLLNERLEGHGWCQTETQSSAARGLLPQGTHEELPVVASSRALERCAPGESFGHFEKKCCV